MPLRRDRAQICLTSKPLLVPLVPTAQIVQPELCGPSFSELVATWAPTLVLPVLQMLPTYDLGRNVALMPATWQLCLRHLPQTVEHGV